MNLQDENKIKILKEDLEKKYEQQQQLAPVRVQDKYNKENLEIQHKYNLEIFEKQAELTREIHDKQSKLTKVFIISTVFAAILGAAIGAILPNLIKYLTIK